MPNATGKESRRYDNEELQALVEETQEKRMPVWVTRGLQEQIEEN